MAQIASRALNRRGLVLAIGVAVPLLLAAAAPTTGGGAGAAVASPAAGTPTAAAPRTVGELWDRMDAAWAGVRSYRATTVFSYVPDPATPGARVSPVEAATVTEEVILPDRRHQVTSSGGVVLDEVIVVAGRLWIRPGDGTAEADVPWLEIDVATLDPTNPAHRALALLAAPVRPAAARSAEDRAQALRPLGSVVVGDRTCEAYGVVLTGAEWGGTTEATIAIGPDDLPCRTESRTNDMVTVVTYEAFNLPLTIEPPANVVPAASPPALGTPIGRD